ncbi:MAG: hypothetical protein ACRCSL_01185 [Microbacterium sp.]
MTYLDRLAALAAAIEPSDWTYEDSYVWGNDGDFVAGVSGLWRRGEWTTDDVVAEYIARACRDVPRLVAALRAVEALHTQTTGYSNGADFDCCGTCFDRDEMPEPWPCPTVTAIRDALAGAA